MALVESCSIMTHSIVSQRDETMANIALMCCWPVAGHYEHHKLTLEL